MPLPSALGWILPSAGRTWPPWPPAGPGLEECGRQVRYGFFQSLAPGEADRILTAHNANDNAETVLMHLCRGTSLPGLLGIPARRGKVLRPLLRVPRGEIEAYCQAHGLPYVTDSSNLSRGVHPATGCGWRSSPCWRSSTPASWRPWPG